MLAQQQAAGWRVTVDGVPREPLTAAGLFRAVAIEKGRHEIIWTYRPAALLPGAVMTLVTLLLLLLTAIVKPGQTVRLQYEPVPVAVAGSDRGLHFVAIIAQRRGFCEQSSILMRSGN